MTPGQTFLIARPQDMLVLAVRWDGLDLVPGAPPRLVAAGRSTIELTFPPQSIAETKYFKPGDVSRRAARLADVSRVTVALDGATDIELSVAGLLGALVGAGRRVESAAVELPWHLVSGVAALSGGDVVADHAAVPIVAGEVVGLWHTRIAARDAGRLDAGLLLLPLDQDPDPTDEGLDVQPLSGDERNAIRGAASTQKPRVRRLELSALGGSLSARQRTTDFSWDHETSLARDEYVRIVMKGVLYPFGHRAEFTVLAQRVFDPEGTPTVAGLHRTKLLVVTEPVRSMAATGRTFPFSEVEVLRRSWTELGPERKLEKPRPVLPMQDIENEQASLEGERNGLQPDLDSRFGAEPHSFEEYIALDPPRGSVEAWNAKKIEVANNDPVALRKLQRELKEEVAFLKQRLAALDPPTPTGPPVPEGPFSTPAPPPPTPDPEQVAALVRALQEADAALAEVSDARIAQAEQNIDRLRQEERDLEARVHAEIDDVDTFSEWVAKQPDDAARRYLELGELLGRLDERVRHIQSLAVPVPFAFVPITLDGEPVRFPLRCAGAQGDVLVSVPLVFVRDTHLDADDHYDAYDTLTDSEVRTRVAAEWAKVAVPKDRETPFTPAPDGRKPGVIELPADRIDLVGSGAAAPPPGDVHEVHALGILDATAPDGFLPLLHQTEVELPAVRALLPEQAEKTVLTYTDAFLTRAEIPNVPFKVVGNALELSFRDVADRSGGLVSPAFGVDAISRTLGPVAAGALPPAVAGALDGDLPDFDLESVYRDATLLGFPLTSLIKKGVDGLPVSDTAPVMEQLFAGGIPDGVSMTWTLELKSDPDGPFRPRGNSRLVLEVRATLAGHTTTCTVNDFTLALPPGDGAVDSLLTLDFEAVVFTQHDNRAPKLDVKGLHVGFGGALKVLDGLRKKLDDVLGLPGNAPTVETRPDGVTAGYGLSVPSAPAGAFLIRNVAMHAGVDVPFNGDPVSVSLSFATRANPFNVSVLAFGGGGYIDLTLGERGITRLEASMEFGATLAVNFVIARGEVHALAGVRFTAAGGSIEIDGYVRIGGSVEVLGLVSVSIELVVTLEYEQRDGHDVLVGSATLVIEIDLTLFAESVEIDSGEWILVGGGDDEGHPAPVVHTDEQVRLDEWKRYRDAFERLDREP